MNIVVRASLKGGLNLDVLLLNPPAKSVDLMEPLGIQYLASALREKGYEVELLDAPSQFWDHKRVVEEIEKYHFKILGITVAFQKRLLETLEMVKELRSRGVKSHIILGGHPPTFTYKEILKNFPVDSIARGEGEQTFLELTEKIFQGEDWTQVPGIAYKEGKQVITNPTRALIKDLDEIPFPARDVLERKGQVIPQISIASSRGCYGFCSFCSVTAFYKLFSGSRWRARKPKAVVDEIEEIHKKFPRHYVFFVDDNFIGSTSIGKQRAIEIAEEIITRKLKFPFYISCRAIDVERNLFSVLKRAGLHTVFLGIESGQQNTLDLFDKQTTVEQNRQAIKILQELEINIDIGFIWVNPYTTLDEMRQDLKFLEETGIGPDLRNLNILAIYPGISLVDKLKSDGLLIEEPLDLKYQFKNEKTEEVVNFLKKILNSYLYPLFQEIINLNRQLSLLKQRERKEKTINYFREKLNEVNNDFNYLVKDYVYRVIDLFKSSEATISKDLEMIEKSLDISMENFKENLSWLDSAIKSRNAS